MTSATTYRLKKGDWVKPGWCVALKRGGGCHASQIDAPRSDFEKFSKTALTAVEEHWRRDDVTAVFLCGEDIALISEMLPDVLRRNNR